MVKNGLKWIYPHFLEVPKFPKWGKFYWRSDVFLKGLLLITWWIIPRIITGDRVTGLSSPSYFNVGWANLNKETNSITRITSRGMILQVAASTYLWAVHFSSGLWLVSWKCNRCRRLQDAQEAPSCAETVFVPFHFFLGPCSIAMLVYQRVK